MSDEKDHYILDTRQVVGNCAMFWRPDGGGYCCDLKEAGLYTEEDAKSRRETDIAIPKALAEACAVTHVKVETLRDALEQAGVPFVYPNTGTSLKKPKRRQ